MRSKFTVQGILKEQGQISIIHWTAKDSREREMEEIKDNGPKNK